MKIFRLLMYVGLGAVLLGAGSGCIWCDAGAMLSDYYPAQFSPDNATVAYNHIGGAGLYVPDSYLWLPLYGRTEIRWRSVASDKDAGAFAVDDWTGFAFLYTTANFVFSPDSRRMAVVSRHHIDIVDLATGKSHRVKSDNDMVTTLFWTGPDEIVYLAHSHLIPRRTDSEEISDLTFWRQNIHEGPEKRVALYQEAGVRAGTEMKTWDLVRPSPDGRYVVFKTQKDGGRFALLTTATGAVRILGPCYSLYFENIAWKPDGSAVVCVKVYEYAVLVEPESGKTEDLSERFWKSFDCYFSSLDPLWTADGKYVIVHGGNDCLVQVHPWKVIPIGERILGRTPHSPHDWIKLHRVPVPGWVLGGGFAVNYETMANIPLDEHIFNSWYWSSDGRLAAGIAKDEKTLVVHTVDPVTWKATPPPSGAMSRDWFLPPGPR